MPTETWIINESFAAGTANHDVTISYTSNGQKFGQISFGKYASTTSYAILYSYKGSDGIWHQVMPLSSGAWTVNGYRTLVFDEPVTDTNLLDWLQTRAVKQSNYSFKHYYKNNVLLGTSTYKFRLYSQSEPVVTPQLAAPTNVSVSGTTVSWNEVENATSYDIYADGTLIGNTDGGVTPKGYKLTLTSIYLNAGQTVSIHMNNADGTSTVVSTLSDNMSWENVVSFWITDSYDGVTSVVINGTSGGTYSEANPYVLTQDTTLTYDNSCLTYDMLVTLSDGSEKQICDLTSDDTYVAYDLATGDLVTAPAKHFDAVNGHSGKFARQYQKYTFEDGTVIKEVNKHRFLNLTRMEFINLCHWEIGDRIYKMDGTTPALVSKEVVTETVEHFTVTTAKYHNGFVQGCLYGDRYTQRYEIRMVDGKPKYDFSKPHVVDYLYGKLSYDD